MSFRKKILHVVHSLEVGGLENGLVNLVNRLDPDRFQHTVCCLTSAGKFSQRIELRDVDLIELHQASGKFRFPVLHLAKIFRKIAPQIVHTRGWPTIDAVFAAKLARAPRIVHGEHGREHVDADGTNRKRNNIRRIVGHLVDRYVVVCDFFRPWLETQCGVREKKIVYIPNGVDTKKFFPCTDRVTTPSSYQSMIKQNQSELRAELGLPVNTVLLGSVGRLDPVKDFPTLLRAFRDLRREASNAKLVIVGDGPSRSKLSDLCNELDLQPFVMWLGERSDIPLLLRSFDIFVQSSIFEGMSNTILEAMACGLPIVATDTGGNPELIEDGHNGRLVHVGDVEKLTETLSLLLADESLRRRYGSNSRLLAENRFDLALMARRYSDLYESLL